MIVLTSAGGRCPLRTWYVEYGIPAALRGPGATALGKVDLSWSAGALSADLIHAVLAEPVAGRERGRV